MELVNYFGEARYLPVFFVENYGSNLVNVSKDTLEIIKAGPDCEPNCDLDDWNYRYFMAWNDLLETARYIDNGKEYYLAQNNDLWLVPVGQDLPDNFYANY